jgi:hypothetical protein
MHIDMRTQAFGSVEVHTVLRESQLGLAVGSEKGDLRSFLALEVPSLQAAIHQQQLRFDSVRFLDHNASSTTFAASADSQSHSQNRSQTRSQSLPVNGRRPEDPLLEEISCKYTTGLSVHA